MQNILYELKTWLDSWKDFPETIMYVCSAILLFTAPAVISMLCYFINTKIRKQNKKRESYLISSNRKINALIVILFIAGAANAPFEFFNCGNTDIGSFFEKNHYTKEYYVYLTDNRNNSKRYKLRATIEKTSPSITEEHYFLKQVYWENGGYLTFSSDMKIGEEVTPNKEVACYDYKDNCYYITLTDEKVK